MNKQEYISALEKALKTSGVRECGDILEEYEEHFDMKTADGYSEEEIAARLAPPEELAGQFKEIGPSEDGKKGSVINKICTTIGVVLVDINVFSIFAMLYGWVITFGVLLISCLALGSFMVAGLGQLTADHPNIHMVPMPYVCSLFVGIALLGLSVLSFIGMVYCAMYINQMVRKFLRWNKNILGKKGSVSPPLSMRLMLNAKKRRTLRTMTLISLVVFAVAFIVGLGLMMILSGSLEPWHVWGWFV